MHDASLGGYGIMRGRFDREEVESVGRYDERWRFSKAYEQNLPPRAHALLALDPFADVESVRPFREARRPVWEAADYPEVPKSMLMRSSWLRAFIGAWRRREAIHMLEGRVGVLALRRQVRDRSKHGSRLLFLSDSLVCSLAFAKGRAAHFGLLCLCRQLCALSIAGNVQARWRWIPSEVNHADADSRVHMAEEMQLEDAGLKDLRRLSDARRVARGEFPCGVLDYSHVEAALLEDDAGGDAGEPFEEAQGDEVLGEGRPAVEQRGRGAADADCSQPSAHGEGGEAFVVGGVPRIASSARRGPPPSPLRIDGAGPLLARVSLGRRAGRAVPRKNTTGAS